MKLFNTRIRKWIVISTCAAVTGVAVGAGATKAAWEFFVQGRSATQIVLLPGGNVRFDSDIARLDTRTGAIYRFRGDIENSSVTNTWELRVAPVKEETSGLLEIQSIVLPRRDTPQDQVEPAVFLVDIVTGRTWILRQRASTNLSWDLVDIYEGLSGWGSN